MFLLITLYILTIFLIWWAYFGYLTVIYLLSLLNSSSTNNYDEVFKNDPSISIIVPCYNEEGLVQQKIENLKELDYDMKKIEIYFLDGCSTDKTVERLRAQKEQYPFFDVIETKCKGKINQINYYLPKLKSDIILNTDMDALMNKDVLRKIVREFQKDKEIYVVGANVSPLNVNKFESQYWKSQNWFRVLESKVVSSSIVIAPCYAFRNGLIYKFPEDCVADDIYISFFANTSGKKTIYLKDALVYETRSPETIEKLIAHKFRKAHAYIMEILRFIYCLPLMKGKWKMIYLTKTLQVLFMPWILIFFTLASISLLFNGIGSIKVLIFSILFLGTSFSVGHLFVQKNLSSDFNMKIKRRSSLAIFLLTNLILFFAGISFPFYVQTSRFKRYLG